MRESLSVSWAPPHSHYRLDCPACLCLFPSRKMDQFLNKCLDCNNQSFPFNQCLWDLQHVGTGVSQQHFCQYRWCYRLVLYFHFLLYLIRQILIKMVGEREISLSTLKPKGTILPILPQNILRGKVIPPFGNNGWEKESIINLLQRIEGIID